MMKKQMRLAIMAVLIAILALTVLSFTVFAANEGALTPVNGVYTVENAEQLIGIFEGMENGTFSATSTIKLANDIDVAGKLPMVQKAFTGIFDGNGKTISGVSNPLFLHFNGTAKNLTLRGKISTTAEQGIDKQPKVASFALNTFKATLTNIVSYVDLEVKNDVFYAGGLVGSALSNGTFVGCEYHGEMKVEWGQANGAVGGILAYYKPDGLAISFDKCYFGGKITVTGGATNQKIMIGGILGQSTSAAAVLKDCVSNGTITSSVAAGDDFVGGIFGLSQTNQNTIEYCSNKSNITAVKNAGGILGGIAANTKVTSCTNHGDMTAANVGEFCGSGKGYTFTCFSSYDFSKADNKICSTDFMSNNSYISEAVTLERTFTLGDLEYEVYNYCTIEKESGLLIHTLKTVKMFEAFVSVRDDGDTEAFRFVILTNGTCTAKSVKVSIQFKDYGGNVIKQYTGILGGANSDLALYSSVAASGENYFAEEGFAIFGCVITEVPVGEWGTVELTVTDTENGTEYLEPVEIDGYKEYLKIESLPDLSVLGDVSGTYNCGPGLMSDQGGYTEEDSFLKVISNTSKAKFEAYVESLEDHGFDFVSKTTFDGDDYYTYARYGSYLYLYYSHRVNEIRVIVDNSSDPLSKISYDYVPKAGEKAEFYQYSINYTMNDQKGFDPVTYTEGGGMNCGMMYILKTADNKIIMIDGGFSSQLSTLAKKHLMNFLREITGTPANEKVTIATWFFTHAHGDHVAAARDILSTYSKQIELESVIFNFPSYQVIPVEYDSNTFTLKEAINRYYPDALYHKLHTGEAFNLGNIGLEVIYTHEDGVGTDGKTEIIDDFNSTSTVLRFTIDGKTFMILGDIFTDAQDAIVAFHSGEYMKSDLMQAAHHGYNNINGVYDMIQPQIVVFPQSMRIAKGDCVHQFRSATKYATKGETYFAHKWTYKFTVEDGVIKSEAIKRYDQK